MTLFLVKKFLLGCKGMRKLVTGKDLEPKVLGSLLSIKN